MSASDWAMMIGAAALGIVSIVNAFGQYWGRKDVKTVKAQNEKLQEAANIAGGKLDVIHDLTNSNMAAVKNQLAAALNRIDKLENLLVAQGRPRDDGDSAH
jgi:cell division septum initiation protein DivIVA